MVDVAPPPDSTRNKRRELVIALFAIFVAYVVRYRVMTPSGYVPDGDGFYIWMFARSLAFDFDIDFTNDYAICGDRWAVGIDHGTGHPANPWYIGPSLLWAPIAFVLRMVLPLAGAPERERLGCSGTIPELIGYLAPVFTIVVLLLGRRIALRFASERAVFLATLAVAFGSPLLVYGSWVWSYSHVWGAFALTAGALFALRAAERRESTVDFVLCGAFFGWAGLMRPHHVVFVFTPFLLTVSFMVDAIRERRLPVREALRGLACLAAFLAVTAIRLWSYDYMYGSPWPPALRSVYLQPAHAHPLLLLFSNRTGFLTYTPLMWLAVIGLFWFATNRSSRRYAVAIVVPFLLDYWACSSPLMWTGSAAIGARLLTSFSGLFLVWSAMSIDRIIDFVTRNRRRFERIVAIVVVGPSLVFAWNMDDPRESLDTTRIYGGTFSRIIAKLDSVVGNPFVFPAPVVFALRYRTPAAGFGTVADYGHFSHDFDDGHLNGRDRLAFRLRPDDAVFSPEWSNVAGGLRLPRRRVGRVIYPLAWPYVTSVRVHLAAPTGRAGCRVRVENHLFFSGSLLGVRALGARDTYVDYPARPGAFDSGINETRIRSNCRLDVASLQWFDSNTPSARTILAPSSARPSP